MFIKAAMIWMNGSLGGRIYIYDTRIYMVINSDGAGSGMHASTGTSELFTP
jgi:hypothetical protein